MILFTSVGCGSPTPEATADKTPEMSTTPLAEALYAGELGQPARALGDRVRLLVWLRSLSLSPEDLIGLTEASRRIHAHSQHLQTTLSTLGKVEFEKLQQPYEDLASSLANHETSDSELTRWAETIAEARSEGEDPRALRAQYAQLVLTEASTLLEQLDAEQRVGMANGLFLLRQTVGDGAAPASFQDLVGTPWRSGEYSTLRKSASPTGVDHLDIGGLWTLESGEIDRSEQILGERMLVITALALSHPDLPSACEVLLGVRDPSSFEESTR